MKGKIYFAGPWFNPAQVKRYEAALGVLRAWRDELPEGRTLYVPRDWPCPPDADDETRQLVYDRNLRELERAAAVVAITDEKDVGTIFELGYAARIRDLRKSYHDNQHVLTLGPKLIGLALDLGDAPFNLMLARGLDATCLSLDDLRAALAGIKVSYVGTIE